MLTPVTILNGSYAEVHDRPNNTLFLLNAFKRCLSTTWVAPHHLQAVLFHVVSTYKKGDPSQLDNCRPISLLNACYELRAALSRERLDKGLDNTIPLTQYGSHNPRSTAQTIYIATRLQD